MDLFILLGTGLLGAMFVSGQGETHHPSFLWQLVFGLGGGAIVFGLLNWRGKIPLDSSISSFLLLFVLGSLAGGVLMFLFLLFQSRNDRR